MATGQAQVRDERRNAAGATRAGETRPRTRGWFRTLGRGRMTRPWLLVAAAALALAMVPRAVVGEDDEFNDPAGTFAWKLPKRWKSAPEMIKGPRMLAVFKGWFGLPDGEEPNAVMTVFVVRSDARAGLALGAEHDPFGTEVEGTRRFGTDFAESARRGITQDAVTCTRRFLEKDGAVICAEFITLDAYYDLHGDTVRKWMDTLRMTGKPAALPAPTGLRQIPGPDYDLYTDAPESSKPLQAARDAIRDAWAATREVLPQDVFGRLHPRIGLYATVAAYDAATKTPNASSYMLLDLEGNASVSLDRSTQQLWLPKVRVGTAHLAVRSYFGGRVPFWVAMGLSTYVEAGLEADGRHAKPKAVRISHARNAVKQGGNRTLVEMIDLGWKLLDPADDGCHEAWAWHAWFRHGDATDDDKDRYRRSLAALREKADVQASRAVWDGSDQAKMAARFRAWLARWK